MRSTPRSFRQLRDPVLAFGLCLALAGSARAEEANGKAPSANEKTEKKVEAKEKPKPVDAVEVKTAKDEEGVKTYKFGAVEVEGRLKAPQILYFLRRVRAEFRAGLLGHRSFMPELEHTRHHSALR